VSHAYVYVVAHSTGAHKVGFTNNVKRRLSRLQTSSPDPLTCVSVWTCRLEEARAIEKAAHGLLAKKSRSGEWFDVAADVAEEAIQRAADSLGFAVERVVAGRDALDGGDVFIGIRTFPNLRDALAIAAKEDGRSISWLVNQLLTDWLRKNGYLPA
jgi:hypothetical protein